MLKEMVFQIILLSVMAIILIILLPFRFGAPFESSSKKRTKIIIDFAKAKKGEKAVDLGSGTGKILIELAKNSSISEVHGYEINPLLVFISKMKIKKMGLEKRVFVHKKNFWQCDLSKYDIITIFQINYVMPKLAKKIEKEAKKSARIISNTWKFPKWNFIKENKGVYLYDLKDRKHL